jgi:predicted nucleic acid-binding protein
LPSRRRPSGPAAAAPARLFVDSGAWLALRSLRDQHHRDAERLFQEAIARRIPLLTTNLVIAEMHRLTLFRAGIEPAVRALQRLKASPNVTIHFPAADDHTSACRWLERLMPHPITYTDAVSFAVMEATRCRDVLGFDSDFVVAGFTLWRGSGRVRP